MWKDMEGTWKKKKGEEREKGRASPPLRETPSSRCHLSSPLLSFSLAVRIFMKTRGHRCPVDNSGDTLTNNSGEWRDASTSETWHTYIRAYEYAHVPLVLVHLCLIGGTSSLEITSRFEIRQRRFARLWETRKASDDSFFNGILYRFNKSIPFDFNW